MSKDDSGVHPIFRTDPGEWMRYVGREVCVTTRGDESFTGWVYTIDPVSQSVVLAKFNQSSRRDRAEAEKSGEEESVVENAIDANCAPSVSDGVSGNGEKSEFKDQETSSSVNDDRVELCVVMGHALQNIVVLDEDPSKHQAEFDAFFKPRVVVRDSPAQIKRRRESVKNWLVKNRLPVSETGDVLSVMDALTIEPPYTAESCRSTNQIVLGRIQGLIANMPKDVEHW